LALLLVMLSVVLLVDALHCLDGVVVHLVNCGQDGLGRNRLHGAVVLPLSDQRH
jgi:hypothetical protein